MGCIGDNTLVAFVDGALDPAARAVVESHVAGCPHCRALLSEIGRSSLVDGARAAAPEGGQLADGALLAERYRIVRFIARGGMGEVYEAEDLELGARVALKMMRPDVAADPRAIDRFKREIHLARRVTHPNVCRIFDVGFAAPGVGAARLPFLTMELLAGDTLSEWLWRVVRLTTDEAMPLARQLASALAAAHDAGVVHRDFKSANIVLVPTADGALRAVVTDFGVARASDGLDFAATSSGARGIVGSPGYMAPEQLQGQEATAAADVYAYGVVLYEMVTGHLPFEAATPMLTALKRLEHPPTPPRLHVPELDERWQRVLVRCLEREPAARYASAMEAFAALGGGSATRFVAPARARQPGDGAALAATVRRSRAESSSQVPASELVARRPAPRGGRLTALALLALSAGVAGVAWRLGQSRHAPTAAVAPAPAAALPPAPAPTPPTTTPSAATVAATTTPVAAPSPTATVLVRSEPAGAQVSVDGKEVGVTPATLSLVLPRQLVLTLPGYRPARQRVTASGTLDVRLVTRRAPSSKRLLDE